MPLPLQTMEEIRRLEEALTTGQVRGRGELEVSPEQGCNAKAMRPTVLPRGVQER
jgi:hypothetical protein